MIGFWILAALISAAAGLLVLLRAGRTPAEGAADPAQAVYARQLREIDELAERGLLGEAELRAARAEAGRRLIAAAETAPEAPAADSAWGRRLALAAAVAAPLAAAGLYLLTGSPRQPDQPFAARLEAWRRADPATLDAARISALLEQAAAAHPTDPEPLLFLARAQAAQGQAALAVHTLEQAVRLAPGRADLWTALGEGLSDLGGGEATPDARKAFERARALDPGAPLPRYRLGRADIAAGRVEQGLAAWRALEAELPAADPHRARLAWEIEAVARTGRLPSEAPAQAGSGEAAGEQRAFIQAMVDRLAARLSAQPEDPAGWARLIHAYGVLGEEDRRRAAVGEVERRYAGRPSLMRSILDGR